MGAGLRSKPFVGRWATVGAALGFVAGGIVGLIVGLNVHAATAWFALFELGVPAGIAGGLIGLIAGLIVAACRRADR
ncbi:MAG: hypothetical protein ACYC91_04960 [Solirubrobacteraceae bacterium]